MSATKDAASLVISTDPSSSVSVFINCPFDAPYRPFLHSIILATVACGFFPRSAIETGTIADSRMTRILSTLFASQYSIHDLSRCRGEGSDSLARFNMPLELGMAIAKRHQDGQHDWAVLVPNDHAYLRFVSDLGGFDPLTHDATIETIVPAVLSWLAIRPNATPGITPKALLDLFPKYQIKVFHLTEEWGEGSVPWRELVRAAVEIVVAQ
jgi:hypothetical protein